jgi:hypothetical protein
MSKLTRVLTLGATLAAMNLAGMTTVAHAQANNEGKDARRRPHPGSSRGGLAPAPGRTRSARCGRRRPAATDRKPGRRALAPPDQRPRTVYQTGRAARLAHGFPRAPGRGPSPGGRASGARRHAARPQHPGRAGARSRSRSRRLMGLPRPPGSPITLPATNWSPSFAATTEVVPCTCRAGRQERITSPLTLSGDLGKRWSAQR